MSPCDTRLSPFVWVKQSKRRHVADVPYDPLCEGDLCLVSTILALGIVSVGVFGTRPASTRIQIEDITMDVN